MDSNKEWENQEKNLLRIPKGLIPFTPAQYGKRLKILRLEKGYSLQAVAEKVGCTPQNVHKIEQGKNKTISRKLMPRFAECYGCSCAYLMGFFDEDMKDVENEKERIDRDLANRSKFKYHGETLSYPVLFYEPDQIDFFTAMLQAYKRDPNLLLCYLALSRRSPEKRRIGREWLEKLLRS